MTRRYAYYCTVCEEVMQAETCPKCPGTFNLRIVKYDGDKNWSRLI